MIRGKIALLAIVILTSAACGSAFQSALEECDNRSEQDINAPVGPGLGQDQSSQGEGVVSPPVNTKEIYFFPTYSESFGISQKIYDDTQRYYNAHFKSLGNTRYVTMINLGHHSGTKRFVLLDLKTGDVQRHVVSHGKGSDPDNDGWATQFSNTPQSNMSSLGFYITDEVYIGKHGRSLRLRGQESTNSNAYARAVVIHGADYVNESRLYAGRSLGCPALDNSVVQGVIDKIRDGALLYIASER